jgi:hypothetical protein
VASPSTGRPGGQVAAIEADPPELAHVAETQLTAVGQCQHQMNVAILRVPAGTTNSWPVILRWTSARRGRWLAGGSRTRRGRHGARAEPDQELFAPPADALDLPTRDRPGEAAGSWLRSVGGQLERGARDPRRRHQASQVAGDGLDFRQFGHARGYRGHASGALTAHGRGPYFRYPIVRTAGADRMPATILQPDATRSRPRLDSVRRYRGLPETTLRGTSRSCRRQTRSALALEQLRHAGADPTAPHQTRHFVYVPGVGRRSNSLASSRTRGVTSRSTLRRAKATGW